MPNWVKTRLTFNGEQSKVELIKEFVKTTGKDDDGKDYTNEFDFNNVIPMPEELNITSSSSGDDGMKYLLLNSKPHILWSDIDQTFMEDMEKRKEKDPDRFNQNIELGRKYLSNIAKYGYKNWYNWRISHWHTKWGAAETEWVNDNQVEFETAWSFCLPIVEKLSQLFPDVEISFCFADEDVSYNCGKGKLKNAEHIEEFYPDGGSNKAYEIYLELHPEDENELVYDPDSDTYKWIGQNDDGE